MSAETISFLEKIVLPIILAVIGLFGGITIKRKIKNNKTINKKVNGDFTGNTFNGDVTIVRDDSSKYTEYSFENTKEYKKNYEYDLKDVHEKYLENAYKSLNKVKNLVSRDTPREIIGEDSIYVSVNVRYINRRTNNDKEISTETVKPLLELSNHILIEGSGGSGKTILMKHFFVNTIKNEFYIPVFVRLNKINKQSVDDISIYNLIYSAIKEFSDDVSDEAFKHSLEKGKYLFLFDGFDEIEGNYYIDAFTKIESFCKKYPDNPCIVTSRPEDNLRFNDFVIVYMMPLNRDQAVKLAGKTGMDDEKTKEFCKQLDEELFDKYKDFAENPLLLSMMFLTFLENGSIPDKIVDFYDRAYYALYNNHDNFKGGYFKRTFESSLKFDEFKNVFSRFCYQTYMAQKNKFTKNEIIKQIKNSMNKCKVDEEQAEKYLNDIVKAVCLIIEEGTYYIFAHHTFQTYFAALYTEKLDDEKQKRLFSNLLSREVCFKRKDYYEILIQLMDERFYKNSIEKPLRKMVSNVKPPFTNDYLIKCYKKFVDYFSIDRTNEYTVVDTPFSEEKNLIITNSIMAFIQFVSHKRYYNSTFFESEKGEKLIEYIEKVGEDVRFDAFDMSDMLTEEEKDDAYLLAIESDGFDKCLYDISNWLNSLDEKRKKLEESTESDNWYEDF